jgi:hypothetical protein
MRRLLLALLLASLAPAPALAGDASVDIGKLEGVYRVRQQNGDSSGAKYTTTDVLEIVRVDRGAAYFAVELHFFNGHMCEQSGIAEAEKGELVYREEQDAGSSDPPRELRLVPKRGRITLEDAGGHCRGMCGARGSFDEATFSLARRRKITNTARLKDPAAYKASVEEYKARKKP